MPKAQEARLDLPGIGYLLVEGIDDWHVHHHLRLAGVSFDIGYCGNDDNLLAKLSAVVVGSGTTKRILGAVLDADADTGVNSRFRSIRDRLDSAYDFPEEFPPNGLIVRPKLDHPNHDRLPVIGVWLMPDNVRDGILEDLLREALPAEQEAYIGKVVDRAREDRVATFGSVDRSKVIVRTHIIWQDPSMKDLGIALAPHFERLEPACRGFFDWQMRLFGEPTGGQT